MNRLIAVLLLLAAATSAPAAEIDALRVDARIWQSYSSAYTDSSGNPITVPLHMPYGTIMNPMFSTSHGTSLTNYGDGGDSAIWTGHYLAAEAYRYTVASQTGSTDPLTGSPSSSEAMSNLQQALTGLTNLRLVTGTGVLARFYVPQNTPFTNAYHTAATDGTGSLFTGTLNGQPYYWVGDTSRDQYSGVMFGLAVAYDLVGSGKIRSLIRREVTAHLNYLLQNNWNVVMPNGHISATFMGRPEQQLAFLQIGRHVDPDTFGTTYTVYRAALAPEVPLSPSFTRARIRTAPTTSSTWTTSTCSTCSGWRRAAPPTWRSTSRRMACCVTPRPRTRTRTSI